MVNIECSIHETQVVVKICFFEYFFVYYSFGEKPVNYDQLKKKTGQKLVTKELLKI